MSLGLKYWYKSQLNSLYIDVSNYVSEQVRGNDSINETPSNFEFTLSVPKNGSDYLDITSGDEIAITFDETVTNLVIHGTIIDSGIDIISFDRLRNKPNYKFNIICSQKDFSNTIIDSLAYTDTNLSVILDDLMNYSDDSLGSPYLSKYAVNFVDYSIASFSVEKKTLREAITDLCQQLDCFWKIKYIVSPDNVNTLFINRYIEFSNKSGIMPEVTSIWQNGITTQTVKNGVIDNPIVGNTTVLSHVVAETDLKIKKDSSVICNYIELIGKIFSENDSTTLYRYDFNAEPSKFEYILNGFASDIVYVAFQLKDPKDPVRIMSGSTTTVIKIPSRFAVGIEIGNLAYFKDDDVNNFYPITSINKIDIYYTEIGFSTPLPFAIIEGHSFEIASNITIYDDKYNLNYSQKGVIKYCEKDREARIKFLDLSEPPPGVFVTVFYKKIQDYKIKFQNEVSKSLYGLRYKEIKLDDDILLTQSEIENLASKLLVLEPKLTFRVKTRRYGIAPVGMNIPVVVNGFLNTNFILESNSWEYLGKDPQKQHIFNQDLDFSNMINTPEQYIKSLKKRKASVSTELNTKNIVKELLNVTEKVTFSSEIPTRITQFPESIIGSWGTLIIDYGYIFNPQSSGDLTDYSGNGNITTLERRNSGDTYQSWVQDGTSGLWGIDFASNYSALKVADSASIELNTDYTIIALVKLNNAIDNTYRIISCKWDTINADGSNIFYFFNQIIETHLRGTTNYPNNGYIFDTATNITDNNLSAYSTSLNCTTDTKFVVKNQTNYSINQVAGSGIISSITAVRNIASDLFLGAFIPLNTGTGLYDWSGTAILQGKLFGYAIIRQSLTEAQIKEIHNVMGF